MRYTHPSGSPCTRQEGANRLHFSLPLEEIGLEDGGELSDVKAFSALGSYFTGTQKILDKVK